MKVIAITSAMITIARAITTCKEMRSIVILQYYIITAFCQLSYQIPPHTLDIAPPRLARVEFSAHFMQILSADAAEPRSLAHGHATRSQQDDCSPLPD